MLDESVATGPTNHSLTHTLGIEAPGNFFKVGDELKMLPEVMSNIDFKSPAGADEARRVLGVRREGI